MDQALMDQTHSVRLDQKQRCQTHPVRLAQNAASRCRLLSIRLTLALLQLPHRRVGAAL